LNAKADQAEIKRIDFEKVSKHQIIQMMPKEDEIFEKSRELIAEELESMDKKLEIAL